MKKLKNSNRKIWIGSHATIGLFIYDEDTQRGLSDEKIRIFKLDQWAASTFKKQIFKSGISDISISIDAEVLGQINKYEKMWENTRVTHCYACKLHLSSMDFSICKECGWIKCKCGACGCGYTSF